MVHSSDNGTALYQGSDYLQVKGDGVCILPFDQEPFFLFLAWKLGRRMTRLHD